MELRVRERFALMNLLAPIESNIVTLRIVRELQERLGFSEEESASLAFQRQGPQVIWRPEADVPKEIEIGPAAKAAIVDQFRQVSERKALSLQQLELYEKFVPEEDSG